MENSTNKNSEEIVVYMFIDALGWSIVNRHKFMEKEFPYRKDAQMQFGYSSAALPTILCGQPPSVHNHFSFFYYDKENSPFKKFKYLKYLFGAGLHKNCIFNRGRVRRYISKFIAKAHGYTGYFNIYAVPFDRLGYYDYCEKQDMFIKGGLSPIENLCDVLDKSGLKYHISNWRNSDADNIKNAKDAIESGSQFLFVYIGSFDGFLHDNAGDENAIGNKLKYYQQMVEDIFKSLKESGKSYKFTLLSDHGMSPRKVVVDLMGKLEKLPLKFGEDYVSFFDSTLARFWYFNDTAKELIRKEFLKPENKCSLISKEEKEYYGIDFKNDRYGQDFFLTDDGIQIEPCDLGAKALNGMHGYSPKAKESYASFLSTKSPDKVPEKVLDFFGIMKSDIQKMK